MNGFKGEKAHFGNARLVAGSFPAVLKDGYFLILDQSGAGFGTGILSIRWVVQFPAEQIHEMEILGVESRLTVTRLATLGLAGAGLRRNRTWIRLRSVNSEAVFEVRADEAQTRAWCSQLPWARRLLAREGSQALIPVERRTEDSMPAALSELARLHRSGALTDSEFAAAKARLLSA